MNTNQTSLTYQEMDPCQHPFLNSLPEALHPVLLEQATRAHYAAGKIIFHQGDPANRFHLIEQGRVALEACSPGHDVVPVQTLGAGDALGWSWLFEPFTWNFQARALEPVTVLVVDAAHLLRLSNENHEFGYELMKRMARIAICRLQATRQRLVELAPMRDTPGAAAPGGAGTLRTPDSVAAA